MIYSFLNVSDYKFQDLIDVRAFIQLEDKVADKGKKL